MILFALFCWLILLAVLFAIIYSLWRIKKQRRDIEQRTRKNAIGETEDRAAFKRKLEQLGFYHQKRIYQIGDSGKYFLVDTALTKFAIVEPYFASSIRIYEVSKIRRFLLDEDQRISVTTSGGGPNLGTASSRLSVQTTYIVIRIFMDDLEQPQLELQFIGGRAFGWSADQARKSANEVLAVLEYLTSQ